MKVLYGLKSSGRCWHDRLFDVLKGMGFFPSKAEADIWMRRKGNHCECIACYVDDLLIASKNPSSIIDELMAKPHSFKLKGTGPISFHLGCDFFRDEDGTLCVGPKKYIERLALQCKSIFGESPALRRHRHSRRVTTLSWTLPCSLARRTPQGTSHSLAHCSGRSPWADLTSLWES